MNTLEYRLTIPETINNDELMEIFNNNLISNNEVILNSLNEFYGSASNIEPSDEIKRVIPILLGKSKLSIRIIDWFVTNFSKKNNIIYPLVIKDNRVIKYFNVYNDYKSQLKGYKKKLFDPFCRKRRIPFHFTRDNHIITTPGQLNFFKWALSNKILDYIEEHFDDINSDMSKSIKYKNTTSSDKTSSLDTSIERKRHELSDNASKSINCIKMKFLLDINE